MYDSFVIFYFLFFIDFIHLLFVGVYFSNAFVKSTLQLSYLFFNNVSEKIIPHALLVTSIFSDQFPFFPFEVGELIVHFENSFVYHMQY